MWNFVVRQYLHDGGGGASEDDYDKTDKEYLCESILCMMMMNMVPVKMILIRRIKRICVKLCSLSRQCCKCRPNWLHVS